jgi:signal transduction histidine kinase
VSDERVTSTVFAYARLLSLAVHELRTPASVVGGYLRMLQRDDRHPLGERQRRMVEEAEKSCARIVALVDELSEISKLDTGMAVVKDEAFDLFSVLEDIAAGVTEGADRSVRLAVRGERAGGPVRGDLARLGAAFGAIFRAVLREQPSATTVVVDRRLGGVNGDDGLTVAVAREDALQAAYEAVPGAFDDRRGGLGLLLPIAERVIWRHGGRIWSPASPDGSTHAGAVIVSLPRSANPI